MRSIFTSLALFASVFAASSELPTIRSTAISSTSCITSQVAPTAFVYANATSNLDLSSLVSSEEYVYEYVTVTDNDEAYVTETICSDGSCYVTTIAESLSTYVITVNGILVTIVTAVPITSVSAVETGSSKVVSTLASNAITTTSSSEESITTTTVPSTTVITLTSCSDNKCSKVVETTGLTTVTDGTTIYTTYCPLSGEESSTQSSAFATSSVETSTQLSAFAISSVETSTKSSAFVTSSVETSTESSAFVTSSVETSTESSVSATSSIESSVEIPTETSSVISITTTSDEPISTKTIPSTIITTIECTAGACSKVTHTTGLTVVTDVSTAYTTYCPLSESSSSSSSSYSSSASSSIKSIPTIDVITGNIVTQSVTTVMSSSVSASVTSSAFVVSTYEAGAQINTFGLTGVVGILLYCLALI